MKQIYTIVQLFFLVVLIAPTCISQTTFQTAYTIPISTNPPYSTATIKNTTDGGYIIGSAGSISGYNNPVIAKFDAAFNLQWTCSFGYYGQQHGFGSVAQTTDGGYMCFFDYGSERVAKVSNNGTFLWAKSVGVSIAGAGPLWDGMATTGGYVMVGRDQANLVTAPYILLTKLNDNGSKLWDKCYKCNSISNTAVATGKSVKQTTDGGFIIAADYYYSATTQYDIILIKTNSVGDTLWTKMYGGTGNDYSKSVMSLANGEYAVGGYTTSFGSGAYDIYLIHTSSNGSIQWAKTYGGTGSEIPTSFHQTTDGGYIFSGRTTGPGNSYNGFLIKTDAVGDTLWTKTYGTTAWHENDDVLQTTDGGYAIAALAWTDLDIIKTDINGVTTGCYGVGSFTINSFSPTVSPGSFASVVASTSNPIDLTASFSTFPLTPTSYTPGCTTLPIEIISFTATKTANEKVELNWATASEINNNCFSIERGTDGNNFETIGKVKGAGNSTGEKKYSFTDEHPFSGINYYRLKQIDFDGNYTYSKIISVTTINHQQLTIYPVPSDKELNCEFYSDENSLVNIAVTDVLGNIILRKDIKEKHGMNKEKLDISNLSQGVYFLKIDNGMQQSQIKFIKQ